MANKIIKTDDLYLGETEVSALVTDLYSTTGTIISDGVGGVSALSEGTAFNKSFGTGAGDVCQGNDSRLSDSRTPTSHATSHASGAGDAIKIDDLAAGDDNTDLNASTSAHGLLPKLDNNSAHFLDGTGTWSTPAYITDHGALTGLSGDDHTQYGLLVGRAGGQTLIGGTGSGENLTLQSTSNATKGKIFFDATSAYDETNARLGIGTTSPNENIEVVKNSDATEKMLVWNKSTGASARAGFTLSNSTGATPNGQIFYLNLTGQNYTDVPRWQNRFVMQSDSGVSGMYFFNTNEIALSNTSSVPNILIKSNNVMIGADQTATAKTHIKGATADSSAYGLKVDNSSNAKNLYVRNDGQVEFKNYTFPIADGSSGYVLSTNGSGTVSWTAAGSLTDHGALTGLSDDDHTQYGLLAGRTGGQTLIGGTASGNSLTLQSTSNATKGNINIGVASVYDDANTGLGIGITSPTARVHAKGATADDTAYVEKLIDSADANLFSIRNDGLVSFKNYTLPTADGTNGYVLKTNGSGTVSWAADAGATDHGALTGLSGDDHTQYGLLVGRAGGQTLIGGTGSGENLTLQSTSNATKGKIFFDATSAYDETNARLGIGTTSPNENIEVVKNSDATEKMLVWNKSTGASARAGFTLSNSTGATPNGQIFYLNLTGQNYTDVPRWQNRFVMQSDSGVSGMYFFNTNEIALSNTSSVPNILIKSNNVMIGADQTATAKTHIKGATADSSAYGLKVDNSSNAKNLYVRNDGQVEFKNYTFPIADGSSGYVLSTNGSGTVSWTAAGSLTDHGALTGLSDDDHTQYGLLAGRTGGQTLKGGTGSGENLILQSTDHATKGYVQIGTSMQYTETDTTLKIHAGAQPRLGIESDSDSGYGPTIKTIRRGDAGGVVGAGESIFNIDGYLNDGTSDVLSASIYALCGAGSSATSTDSVLYFSTTPNGSETMAESMKIAGTGYVYFNRLHGTTGGSDMRFNTSTKEMFYDTSSLKYKENLSDDVDISWLYDVKVKTYDRKDGSRKGEIGIIAEELYKLAPDFVALNEDGEPEAFSKGDLVPVLLKALQEQCAEIADMKVEIATLKGSVASNKGRLTKLEKAAA
jgi:hypothetical protein